MGMSYRYAGSASYPRFDEEVCTIAMPYKIGCVRGGANWDEGWGIYALWRYAHDLHCLS